MPLVGFEHGGVVLVVAGEQGHDRAGCPAAEA
jgi:hypothetical protein